MTTSRRRWSSRRRGASSSASARGRISHVSPPRRTTRTACRRGSSRCFGSSLRGRAIARSPRCSSSASTRSRGTSRTSSRSSGSRPAQRRPRSLSSTTSSRGSWSEMTTSARTQVGGSARCGGDRVPPTVDPQRRGGRDGTCYRAIRDRDHRWWPGRARDGLSPGEAGSLVRHSRRKRTCRRRVAQPLGLPQAVLTGGVRRAAGEALRSATSVLPDNARDGRLPRGVRNSPRASRAFRNDRRRADEGRRRLSWCRRAATRWRPTTSSSRRA